MDEIGCSRIGTPSAQMISMISSIHLPGAQILLELILNYSGIHRLKHVCIYPHLEAILLARYTDIEVGDPIGSNKLLRVDPLLMLTKVEQTIPINAKKFPQSASRIIIHASLKWHAGIQAMRILGDLETIVGNAGLKTKDYFS